MVSLKAEHSTIAKTKADVAACFVVEDKKRFDEQINSLKVIFKSVAPALNTGVFTGKFQETLTLFPSERKIQLLLVGLGKTEKLTHEKLRRVAATAAKSANSLKAKALALIEPDIEILSTIDIGKDWQAIGAALAEGAALSLYKYNKYFTVNNKKNSTLKQISVVSEDAIRTREIGKGNLDYAIKIASRDEFGQLGSAFNNMSQELKGSQEELLRSKEILTRVTEGVDEGLMLLDTDFKIIWANKKI
ncbi:MAG: M17 family peptidase N-terminal domain-containing protein, partial [Bacteroidota bacterium]